MCRLIIVNSGVLDYGLLRKCGIRMKLQKEIEFIQIKCLVIFTLLCFMANAAIWHFIVVLCLSGDKNKTHTLYLFNFTVANA